MFECELDSLRTSLLILWKEFKNLFLEGSHKINLEVLDENNEPRTSTGINTYVTKKF